MTAQRVALSDFALANPLYAGVSVTIFAVDPGTLGKTSALAPVYADLTSASQLSNPQVLDSEGKWQAPLYVDQPVVLYVGAGGAAAHQTGVTGQIVAFQGDWAPATYYGIGQIVRDGAAGLDTGNLYMAVVPGTSSGSWAADLAAGAWKLYQDLGGAVQEVLNAGWDASNAKVTPAGASTARTLADRLGDVISLNDYPVYRDGVHDDSAAVAAALTAAIARQGKLYVPEGGPILLAGAAQLPTLQNVALIGPGVDVYGLSPSYKPASLGATFYVTDMVNTPFTLGRKWKIEGINVFYPNQTEANCNANGGVPAVYPPLFKAAVGGAGRGRMRDVRVVNCYDFFVADQHGSGVGDILMDNVRAFAVRDYFRLRAGGEIFNVTNSLFSLEPYDYGLFDASLTTHTLLKWHTDNSCFQHLVGDGAADSTGDSCGLTVTDSYLYGMKTVCWADTGSMWSIFSNVGMDGVQIGWRCDPGGSIYTSSHNGGNIFQYNAYQQIVTSRTALKMNPVSAPGTTIDMPFILADQVTRGFDFQAKNLQTTMMDGVGWNVSGSGVKQFAVENCEFVGLKGGGTAIGTQKATAAATTRINGNVFASVAGHDWTGLAIGAGTGLIHVQGNSFAYPNYAVDLTGANGGATYLVMDGNASWSTNGTYSVNNPGNAGYSGVNYFDKTVATAATVYPLSVAQLQNAQTFSGAGTANQVILASKGIDRTGSLDANGVFTAPMAGTYAVTFEISHTSAGAVAGDIWLAAINQIRAGATIGYGRQAHTMITSSASMSVSGYFQCNAGDTIEPTLTLNVGTGSWTTQADGGMTQMTVRYVP